MSERALQTVKILIEKTEYPYLSMLEYRTTPVFWIVSSRIVDEQEIIIYRSNNQRHTNNKETTAYTYSIYLPKRIPFKLQEEFQGELNRMKNLGVIAESEVPSELCCPMVVDIKSNGKIIICSDLTKLNKSVKR